MSEPRRLLEEGSSGLEAELLRSARWDAPPPLSRRKALVALGVGSATAVAGTSTAAATVAGASSTVALVKWIAGGVIAGVLAVGAASVVRSSGEPARGNAPTATAGVSRLAPPGDVAPVAVKPAVSSPPEEPAHEEIARDEPTVKAVSLGNPAPSPALTLADEVASLDAARAALARGDAAGALSAVDDHDRRFHGGALGPEATVVRIDALALRGDRATATRMANAFLASHPTSPHANHLRTLTSNGLGHDGEPTKTP